MSIIYRITCTTNGKFYVGSTINKKQRWNRHRRELRAGTHPNKNMLASWQKYGEASFVFEVLEELADTGLLFAAEQRYLDQHAGKEYCFNWAKHADAPMRGRSGADTPNYGRPVGPETRALLRAANSGESNPNWGRQTPLETRERIRAANKANPAHRKKHTPEAIAKIAAASKGRPVSAETRAKRSAALKGREIPLEQRLRISQTLSGPGNYWYGKTRPDSFKAKVRKAVATYREGVLVKTYPSITALRAEFGATPTTVNRLLKSGVPARGSVFGDLVVAYLPLDSA
jgi:group I intron endonuclease